MIINRLPTEQDVDGCFGIEIHSFTEAFNECSVAPFVAKLEFKSEVVDDDELWERYDLNGWSLSKDSVADWFTIADEHN